jgi:hypothetical protein
MHGSELEARSGDIPVDYNSQEIEQIRNNPELMKFLAQRSQKKRFSLEQVKQKLGLQQILGRT